MANKRTTSEADEPLVECALCGAVTGTAGAETRWVNIRGRPEKVWICKTCIHLGKGDRARKYVMREGKHGR